MSDDAETELERLRALLEAFEDQGATYAANKLRMALLAAEGRAEALPKAG